MTKRLTRKPAVNVGFDSKNLSEAVDLLQWIASRSKPGAVPDDSVADQAITRERLMARAEQPFLEEQDHVVYGRVYGLRNENFGAVYDAVPPTPESPLETRTGEPATVLAKFWICP